MTKDDILKIFRIYFNVRSVRQQSQNEFTIISDDLYAANDEQFDSIICTIKERHPELDQFTFHVDDTKINYIDQWKNLIDFREFDKIKTQKLVPTKLSVLRLLNQIDPQKLRYIFVCHNNDPNPFPFLPPKTSKTNKKAQFSKILYKQKILVHNLGFFINHRLLKQSFKFLRKHKNVFAIDKQASDLLKLNRIRHVYLPLDLLEEAGNEKN